MGYACAECSVRFYRCAHIAGVRFPRECVCVCVVHPLRNGGVGACLLFDVCGDTITQHSRRMRYSEQYPCRISLYYIISTAFGIRHKRGTITLLHVHHAKDVRITCHSREHARAVPLRYFIDVVRQWSLSPSGESPHDDGALLSDCLFATTYKYVHPKRVCSILYVESARMRQPCSVYLKDYVPQSIVIKYRTRLYTSIISMFGPGRSTKWICAQMVFMM